MEGFLWCEKVLLASATFSCLWLNRIKKNNPALLKNEWANSCINYHGNF